MNDSARVLIVDDEERIRLLLRALIEKDGYECHMASNGVEALSALRENDFRVVVADLRMPQLDGIGLLSAIKEAGLETVPVVLTGHGDVSSAVEAMKLGAYDFLTKPITDGAAFRRVIAKAMEHARVLRRSRVLERVAAEWESTFDASPDLMAILDKEERIIRCNRAMAERMGVNKADLEGVGCRSILNGAMCAASCEDCSATLANGGTRAQEVHNNRLRGDFLVTTSPLRNAEGEFFGAVYIARDITERKRMENALAARAHLAALNADVSASLTHSSNLRGMLQRCAELIVQHLEAAFTRIWTLNQDENVLELQASAGMYTHVDGPHARVPVGKFKIGLIAEERKPHLTNAVIGDSRVGDQEWAKREGMVAFAGYPLIMDDQLVGVMATFARQPLPETTLDVLESVADEIALGIERKRAEEALRKMHKETENLLAAISSILIGVGEDDRITQWNQVAARTFDVQAADVVGKPFGECGIPWDWNYVLKLVADCRKKDHPTRLDDVRFTRPDGKEGFVGMTINPIKGDAGEPTGGFLLLGADITQRRILESQLAQSQKLESIGRLAAGIAHEINTPTQYVGDNTRFLQDAFGDISTLLEKYDQLLKASKENAIPPELIEDVESTAQTADVEYLVEEIPAAIKQSLEGVERVAKIVRAMKEFSHPGVEGKTPIDLNKSIESTVTVARNEWKYVADMETNFDPNLPLVTCLPGDLNQVFLNMIVNSAHAIADVVGDGSNGKGTIRISTRHVRSAERNAGDWAEVRIGDTGVGIPKDVISKIFDPFFTTKQVGKGTGQGLAISYNVVVEKHGGTIDVESEVGKGTTFIIRLPIAEVNESMSQ